MQKNRFLQSNPFSNSIRWIWRIIWLRIISFRFHQQSEDLSFAGDALKQIGVTLQFFHELSAYAKRYVRIAKRELPKNEYEDMIDRKEIIAEITNALTELKNGLSRNVTTYTRGLDEMHLL